jgi:transcriptional regulator with XRE-family HTH domain
MPAHDGPHGEPGEDVEAFLRDLRALRSREGLSIAELAARTGLSQDTIAAAADGPVRPTLPVLEAYVRGCGDSLEAWEGRWKDLPPATSSNQIAPRQRVTGITGQPEFSIKRLGPRPAPPPGNPPRGRRPDCRWPGPWGSSAAFASRGPFHLQRRGIAAARKRQLADPRRHTVAGASPGPGIARAWRDPDPRPALGPPGRGRPGNRRGRLPEQPTCWRKPR